MVTISTFSDYVSQVCVCTGYKRANVQEINKPSKIRATKATAKSRQKGGNPNTLVTDSTIKHGGGQVIPRQANCKKGRERCKEN